MSYHTVVHALEAGSGLSPLRRFWLSIRHAAQGQIPYVRYQAAGFRRATEGSASGEVERWLLDWASIDLNPVVQMARTSTSAAALIEGYNAFNRRISVEVSTTIRRAGGDCAFERELRSSKVDPEPCKTATLFAMHAMVSGVAGREGRPHGAPLSIGAVARALGVERSASAELAGALEAGAESTTPEAARALGVSTRTLQRSLQAEGGCAEDLKLAARLLRAFAAMGSSSTLTEIAHHAGYADSAHMSRSFMSACGMTPTEVRAAAYPGVELGRAPARPRSRPACAGHA